MTSPLLSAGYYTAYQGAAAGAGLVPFTTEEVSGFDSFMLMSDAGSVQLEGQLVKNGVWTSALALQDLTDSSGGLVVATVAGKVYGLVGNFYALRTKQVGGTAVTNVTLRGWSRSYHG